MRFKLIISILALSLSVSGFAQWTVFDPSGLAQGIVNTSKQIIETSTIAGNTLSSFQETVKIFEQGKEYYDALKNVKNLVKDARKVQQTILMVGEISEIYVVNFQKMLADPNYYAEELDAIAQGYTILMLESSNIIEDLKQIINPSILSMSDKDRMDIIDTCYESVGNYRNLVLYYTNKNISVSYLRSQKKGEMQSVIDLYGSPSQKYW